MPEIRRSKKTLSGEQLRKLKASATAIDRDESPAIRQRGKAIFDHHQRLRSILDQLIAERKRRGLSLTALAELTGIAKPNLSRLENSDHTTPTLDTLERYATAVGKTLRVELMDAA